MSLLYIYIRSKRAIRGDFLNFYLVLRIFIKEKNLSAIGLHQSSMEQKLYQMKNCHVAILFFKKIDFFLKFFYLCGKEEGSTMIRYILGCTQSLIFYKCLFCPFTSIQGWNGDVCDLYHRYETLWSNGRDLFEHITCLLPLTTIQVEVVTRWNKTLWFNGNYMFEWIVTFFVSLQLFELKWLYNKMASLVYMCDLDHRFETTSSNIRDIFEFNNQIIFPWKVHKFYLSSSANSYNLSPTI